MRQSPAAREQVPLADMRLRGLAILAACAAGGGDIGGGRRPQPDRSRGAGMPHLPGLERLEQAGRPPARGGELGRDDQRDRGRRERAPGLRLVPRLRHPVHRRLGEAHAQGEGVVRVRRRIRSRRLPDPGAPEPGVERRRAHPARRQGRVPPLRAVRRERQRRRLEGRIGRRLEPALQPPAAQRLDVGRRRRPADPARPRALRRGRRRRDPPRPALHGRAHRERPTSTRPATTPATPTRSLPPMGLRVRLKASVDISGLQQAGARRRSRRSRPTG